MSTPLAIALYFVIWWTTLFAILPIGLRTQGEASDVVPGTPSSAPHRHRMMWVVAVNSAVAAVVFMFVLLALSKGWIPLDFAASDLPAGASGKR